MMVASRTLIVAFSLSTSLLVMGCAESKKSQKAEEPPYTTGQPEPMQQEQPSEMPPPQPYTSQGGMPGGQPMGMGMCPMDVQGTRVTVYDTPEGVAEVFTTQTGDVYELRRRVAHMAEIINQQHAGAMGQGSMGCGGMGGTDSYGSQGMGGTDGYGGGGTDSYGGGGTDSYGGGQGAGGYGGTDGYGSQGTDSYQGGQGMGGGMPPGAMTMPHATARVDEIEGGARLVLTPMDPNDIDQLRMSVQRHVERLQGGECPMMRMQWPRQGELGMRGTHTDVQ